jgi:hypothetical protein
LTDHRLCLGSRLSNPQKLVVRQDKKKTHRRPKIGEDYYICINSSSAEASLSAGVPFAEFWDLGTTGIKATITLA